jgi:PEGA domain
MSATLARLTVVCCMLSTALAQSSSPPPPSSQGQPTNAQANRPSKGFVLEDGTAVTLRLGRSLSSADAHAGDRVDFEVAEEVSVNRIVVIPKDSPASGTVVTAHKKRRMGRAGKLDVSIDSVQLASGEKATLRAVKESQGGSHTGIMAGGMVATSLIVWPAAPVFLLMHGKDVTIPKGTEVTAYLNGDVKLDPAKFQPAPFVPAAPPVPSTQEVPPSSPAATPNAGSTDTTPVSPDQGAAAELEVSSTPDGADIEIDGNFVGSTPSTVGVVAGSHQLSVKKAGFKPWERKITVSSGHIKIDATLEAQSN